MNHGREQYYSDIDRTW